MSRFATITATNAVINNLSTDNVQSINTNNTVSLLSDVNLNGQSIHNVARVDFGTYEFIEDTDNNTIGVHIVGTRFRGALYDTTINRPFEQILPVSSVYTLPADKTTLVNNIGKNPTVLYNVICTENTEIALPSLTPTSVFQNIHLRLSNDSAYLITFSYNGRPIVRIGYERVSFVWRTENGVDYSWVYVP